ncbi:MAG TPA: bifunctional hydroxymethylpyrimidine kinase/phosphomethylpyrimidine kinase [Gaiellaceae bacterium]|nr:bifunctional hydroxymethylpyrimidine kinase/phosphomethylpyrimidine kinase [Gaiellaceae bacterium]
MSGGPSRLLTIAGSDPSGGAGIQADLATFAVHGAYGMSVVTAVTVQSTVAAGPVHLEPAELVGAQLDAVLGDLGVDAVKTGMLGGADVVATVAERLAALEGVPVVVDPVFASSLGRALLDEQGIAALRSRLAPLATLLTPNLPEAERLAGRSAASAGERAELARELGGGRCAVLLKGGHAPGDEIVDLLWDGSVIREIRHQRIATRAGHGTGCALSAAVAARLGRGERLEAACRGAVEWVSGALAQAQPLGAGSGPLDVLWTWRLEGRCA